MSKRKRVLHCWADGPSIVEWIEANAHRDDFDIEDYVGWTCMLEKGHDGPHEFTPDNQIGISFAPSDTAKDSSK